MILFYVIYALTVSCNVPMNYLHCLLYLYVVCNTGQLSASMGFLYEYVVTVLIEGHRVPYVFFLQYCNCVLCSLRRVSVSLSLLCTVFNNFNKELQEPDPQRAETIRAGVIRVIASRAKLYEPEPFLLMQSKGAASARSMSRAWRLGDTASDHYVHT